MSREKWKQIRLVLLESLGLFLSLCGDLSLKRIHQLIDQGGSSTEALPQTISRHTPFLWCNIVAASAKSLAGGQHNALTMMV